MVLDCSPTIAWALDENAGEWSASVIDVFGHDAALVPSIWPSEVANALLRAERSGRLDPSATGHVVAAIEELPVEVDVGAAAVALHTVLDLARESGLTTYDASYLELALRLGLPLATLDRRLAEAAREHGVEVL